MSTAPTLDAPPVDGAEAFLRVYRSEWVTAHTIMTNLAVEERAVLDELQNVGRTRFEDIATQDSRVEIERRGRYTTGRLLLRLPVCKGEFRFLADAQELASRWPDSEITITERDSPYDRHCQHLGRR